MGWEPEPSIIRLIRNLALQNAMLYEGEGKVGSVMGRIMGTLPELRSHAKDLGALIGRHVSEANTLAKSEGISHVRSLLEEQAPELLEKKKHVKKTGLPDLPNPVDKPVFRFAPNPNGPLSFGHSRGLVINAEYAKQLNGELILRFDDTDTTVKPPMIEAYEMIMHEQEWLCGFKAQRVIIASERMEEYHKYAQKLLANGYGYVCQCSSEDFREYRKSKENCPCRNQENSEAESLWKMMNDENGFQPGDAVVRVKTDMTLPNPALRDWPALRIQTNAHPRVGNKWRVWPLLDFQSAVEDHLQGVTHIIRGKDLMDSTRKQKWLYKHFGWNYPETIYWGRVKVHEFGGFSTSGMKEDIKQGTFTGWDDIRLPTLGSLKRRGIRAEALQSFWIEIGLTQKDISVPLTTLFSHNTSIIDPSSPRLSFVRDAIEIELKGEYPAHITLDAHPSENLGKREIDIDNHIYLEKSDLGNVRLKDFCDISKDGVVESIERSDNRTIVHWVSGGHKTMLLTPEGKEILKSEGILENHQLSIGTIVQLERIGYAKLEEDKLVFLHA